MLKKILLTLLVFSLSQTVWANEVLVEVKPQTKISTSNSKLQEGDAIKFVVANDVFVNSALYIKKSEVVEGVITSIDRSDFLYKPASIYAENFVTRGVSGKTIKLNGIVYKKGNDYWMITQFIPIPLFLLRGGNVNINPKKDSFTLYVGGKTD